MQQQLAFVLLLVVAVATASSVDRVETDYQTCQAKLGGVLFDLTSLTGNDLTYGAYNPYWLSFCSSISRNQRCSQESSHPNFCQDSDGSARALSSWTTTAPKITWMLQRPGDVNSGLFIVFPNTTVSSPGVYLNMKCVPNSLPRITNVAVQGNIFYVYVETARACPNAPEPWQGCSWSHNYNHWDLSEMKGKEVNFLSAGETYYLSFCGVVPHCISSLDYPNLCSSSTSKSWSTWTTFGAKIEWGLIDPQDVNAGITLRFPANNLYPRSVNITIGCMPGVQTYITDVENKGSYLNIFAESKLACPN
eukprot:TRINITY_DN11677_c0_g1_i1.p1 TRINITY_DN11677_c0_g1~~TRINITY_DN11677_c0_g1_i1.p1  ORF type:complete len:324 (+),score=54.82 TRINITY_DN11677_c0_g1_i1:56-973(+)